MNHFKSGSRVKLKSNSIFKTSFGIDTAVVVGHAFLHTGTPCLVISTDEQSFVSTYHGLITVPRFFTERLVVPIDCVEAL